jgi:hypothetical protein
MNEITPIYIKVGALVITVAVLAWYGLNLVAIAEALF